MHVEEIDTPAVTILLDRLEANIKRGQSMIAAAKRANRPHIKTHKIPAIAKMQMEAGAIGITCQKLGEAEVFIDAGAADDILLTYNILGDAKLERLMELSKRVKRLAVVADNDVVVRGLSDAGRRHGQDVPLLIECDSGFGRNGVRTPDEALELARFAMNMPNIRFEGLATYPNSLPKTRDFFTRALEIFAADGIPLPVLSGGGTPALSTMGEFPMMTEHRAGTYVYNDRMMMAAGAATLDDCAMQIRATVVSMPEPDLCIVDAGSKVLARESISAEGFGLVAEYPDALVANLSEEHGMVDLSRSARKPKVGEAVSIIPNHTCVVTNLVDQVYGVRNGEVEVVWPVAARGKSR
jgi:D-serine deaminase-like pyridoxal phosphate-dependent protein